MQAKYARLQDILRDSRKVLVAYSGGVDSTFLLKAAFDTLQDNAIGVIGISPTIGVEQVQAALMVAKNIGSQC